MNNNASPHTFRNFIFDLDGTLLDTIPDLVLLTNHILEQVECPLHTREEIVSYVGNGVRRLMYQALPHDASEELRERAMDLWNEKFHHYYENTFPFDGIIDVLDSMKQQGCKLGIVSNKLQSGVDVIICRCLPGYFDVMLGESPLCPRKPDPTGIELAMQVMGAAPADTIYIGDAPSDIIAAHNAGLFAAAALWGYHKPEDFPKEGNGKPDLILTEPRSLLNLIA